MALPAFDDIDLDMDPEDEAKILLEADEGKPEEKEEKETEGEPEEVAEEQEPEAEDDPVARAAAEIEEVRQERVRLQEQLNELTVRSALDGRKLAELERDLSSAKKAPAPVAPEEAGPTPEEVLSHLDQRIAIVDAKLAKAELEDPAAAPPLRAQLRQLERYFADYKANVMLSAAKGPDPDVLVQQAAEEAQQQARFSNVRSAVTQEYPNLDPRGQYFNPELRDMVHEIYNPMLAQGADPTEALIKAATLVMRANGIPSVSEYNQQQAALAAQQAAAPPPPPVAPARKKESVAKNVAAAAAIPPDISALGNSNKSEGLLGKYDFQKMDIKEFMRLTDEDEERIENALSMYEG